MGAFPHNHDSTSDPGIALRQWVHFQGVHNILDLLSWDEEELKAVFAQQIYSLCRILGLTTFNSLLQYVNRLVWEVCSVN